jgi:hypothetical protein
MNRDERMKKLGRAADWRVTLMILEAAFGRIDACGGT